MLQLELFPSRETREIGQKFLARANIKGYCGILVTEVVVSSDAKFAEIKEKDAKRKEDALCKLNKDTYINLLLSISTDNKTGRVAFQIIWTAKTKDLVEVMQDQSGNA